MKPTLERSCSRCGDPASFLVAGGRETQAAGRLMIYCDRCQASPGGRLDVSVPLAVLDHDSDGLLTALYRAGVTRTSPDAVQSVVGVSGGTWSDVARVLIADDDQSGEPELPELDVTRAASPFARAIYAKAVALRHRTGSPAQRQRLRESITVDLRKCSDVLTPDLVPAAISEAADSIARTLGADLSRATWQGQKKFDPDRSVFHFEHIYPVGQIRTRCLEATTALEIVEIIREQLRVAWITKDEDKRLSALKFGSNRPDPQAAYAAAGIVLVESTHCTESLRSQG